MNPAYRLEETTVKTFARALSTLAVSLMLLAIATPKASADVPAPDPERVRIVHNGKCLELEDTGNVFLVACDRVNNPMTQLWRITDGAKLKIIKTADGSRCLWMNGIYLEAKPCESGQEIGLWPTTGGTKIEINVTHLRVSGQSCLTAPNARWDGNCLSTSGSLLWALEPVPLKWRLVVTLSGKAISRPLDMKGSGDNWSGGFAGGLADGKPNTSKFSAQVITGGNPMIYLRQDQGTYHSLYIGRRVKAGHFTGVFFDNDKLTSQFDLFLE